MSSIDPVLELKRHFSRIDTDRIVASLIHHREVWNSLKSEKFLKEALRCLPVNADAWTAPNICLLAYGIDPEYFLENIGNANLLNWRKYLNPNKNLHELEGAELAKIANCALGALAENDNSNAGTMLLGDAGVFNIPETTSLSWKGTVYTIILGFVQNKEDLFNQIACSEQTEKESTIAFLIAANPVISSQNNEVICKWLNQLPRQQAGSIFAKMAAYISVEEVGRYADSFLQANPAEAYFADGNKLQLEDLSKWAVHFMDYATLAGLAGKPDLAYEYSKRALEFGANIQNTLVEMNQGYSLDNPKQKPDLWNFVASDRGAMAASLKELTELKTIDPFSARNLAKKIAQEVNKIAVGKKHGRGIEMETHSGWVQIPAHLSDLGLFQEAAQVCESLLDLYPRDEVLLAQSANLYFEHGDFEKASGSFLRLDLLRNLTREEKTNWISALQDQGNWEEALAQWGSINLVNLEDHRQKAQCAYRAQDIGAFQETAQTASVFYPNDTYIQLLEALLEFKQANLSRAFELFESMLTSNQRDTATIQLIIEFFLLNQKFEEAQSYLNLLTMPERQNVDVLGSQFALFKATGNLKGCQAIIHECVSEKKEIPLAVVLDYIQLFIETGQFNQAKTILEACGSKWVLCPKLTGFTARLHIEEEQYEQAALELEHLLDRDVIQPEWLRNYGLALLGCRLDVFPLHAGQQANPDPVKVKIFKSLLKNFENNLHLRILEAELNTPDQLENYKEIFSDEQFQLDCDLWRVHAGMGARYMLDKKFDLAIVNLLEAIKAQPRNILIRKFMIQAYARMQLFTDALQVFSDAIDLPYTLEDLLELNGTFKKQACWQKALTEHKLHSPNSWEIDLALAFWLASRGQTNEAMVIVNEVNTHQVQEESKTLILAQLLMDLGQVDYARQQLAALLSSNIALSLQAHLDCAFLYDQMGEGHKAANILNLIDDPDYASQGYKASLYDELGLRNEALLSVEKAIEILETQSGKSGNAQLNGVRAAEKWRSVQKAPQSLYGLRLDILLRQGRLGEALNAAKKYNTEQPGNHALQTCLLEMACLCGEADLALGLIEGLEIQSLDFKVSEDLCIWADAALNHNQEILAATLVTHVVENMPLSPSVKVVQSRLLLRNGNHEDARALYESINSSLTDDPKSMDRKKAWLFTWMAEVAFDLGENQSALIFAQNVMNYAGFVFPALTVYLKALRDILRLKWMCEKVGIQTHLPKLDEKDISALEDIRLLNESRIKNHREVQELLAQISIWQNWDTGAFQHMMQFPVTLNNADEWLAAQIMQEGWPKASLTLEKLVEGSEAAFICALLILDSHPEDAVGIVAQLLKKNPERPPYYAAIALAKKSAGQLDDAYASIHLALSLWGDEYQWQIMAGELTQQLGDLHASLGHFRKATALQPDGNSRKYLENLALQAGTNDGIAILEQKLVDSPVDLDTLLQLSKMSLKNRKPQKAAKYLERARLMNPLDVRAYILMGQLAIQVGNYQKASEIIARAENISPLDTQVILTKANIIENLHNKQQALDFLKKKGSSFSPAVPEIKAREAEYIAEIEGPEKALEALLSCGEAQKSHEGLMMIAQLYLHIGNSLNAKEFAERALQMNDRQSDVIALLGKIALQNGDLDMSTDFLVKAIQMNPFVGSTYFALAQVFQARRDTTRAVEVFKNGINALPDNFDLLNSLGMLYYQKGDYSLAEEALGKAAALNPRSLPVKRMLSALKNANIIQTSPGVSQLAFQA